jgi:hypothetical protein
MIVVSREAHTVKDTLAGESPVQTVNGSGKDTEAIAYPRTTRARRELRYRAMLVATVCSLCCGLKVMVQRNPNPSRAA